MRIPRVHEYRISRVKDKKEKIDYETIQVTLQPSEYIDDLRLFEDEKELHKFVVRTKYYIRKSYEYTKFIEFLKKYRGLYCCGIHPNITIWDKFSIEVHHTPLTMEDILYIIINKRMKRNESLKQSAIAKEVMQLHYLGLIGLYPLCDACHTYVHSDNNDLFIPFDALFGDPEKFFDIYQDFITNTMKVKFKNLQELNKGYSFIQNEVPEALIRKYILVQDSASIMISTKRLETFIKALED